MTKREFDALTKLNYGARYHGATHYRREVRLKNPTRARDYVEERAWEMARRNYGFWTTGGYRIGFVVSNRDGFLPTLSRGSRFRAPQAFRAKQGLPLLTR